MSPNDTPRCVICKSELIAGARKCIECGSFQHGVRRFLAGLDIGSLVALVPVVALVVAFLQDRVVVHRSEVHVSALQCETDGIKLLASNLGDRPGVMRDARVRLVVDGQPRGDAHHLQGTGDTASYTVVQPEQSLFADLAPVQGGALAPLDRYPVGAHRCRYELEVEVIEFAQDSDEPRVARASCPCPR